MIDDAYEICRRVRRYQEKNGYAPKSGEVGAWCSTEFLAQLVRNGVVEVRPLYAGGPPISVFLTDKGLRMATVERTTQRAVGKGRSKR